MATIEIRTVTLVYPDGTRAMEDISLAMPEGKVTAVLGPSGSGKTSMLRVIAGLLEPSSGQVVVDGRDVTGLPLEKRNIGMVFQSYALFPNMTVEENVEFGLKVRRVPPAERRARVGQVLDTVRIGPLAKKRIRQISGGEAQRVALARAIVYNPRILLMDEPLSALDAKIREELRGELRQFLQEFGTTTVYVTHDQTEAMALGDRVVVMNRGRVVQVGTPPEIYQNPANLFVATFIGHANLCPCEIASEEGGRYRFALPWGSFSAKAGEMRASPPLGRRMLMIRPEDLAIATHGAEAHCVVRVEEVLYLGNRLRVGARTESAERMLLDVENTRRVEIGERVPVRLDLAKLHLLDPEPGPPA
ncbi:MAG: ABC transporter ATP-binding protein [Candidatus Rokubacteria bacterium]|nr:ABC transporter ATP-binding protein [Candidatus Rokubacteria bacterium]